MWHVLMQVLSGYVGVSMGCEDHETLILCAMIQYLYKEVVISNGFLHYCTSTYILKCNATYASFILF